MTKLLPSQHEFRRLCFVCCGVPSVMLLEMLTMFNEFNIVVGPHTLRLEHAHSPKTSFHEEQQHCKKWGVTVHLCHGVLGHFIYVGVT